mgnify:CR=1 FL=1
MIQTITAADLAAVRAARAEREMRHGERMARLVRMRDRAAMFGCGVAIAAMFAFSLAATLACVAAHIMKEV